MAQDKPSVTIIRKVRKGGHGHHGGAWKVAYADFVTAMMALFLVLWLTSQDQKIRDAVARAFNHPFVSPTEMSAGIIPPSPEASQVVRASQGNFDSSSKAELDMLRRINEDLIQSLQTATDEQGRSTIAMEMTPEGLRISVFDRAKRAIFEPNSTKLTEYGKFVLSTLSWGISRYPTLKIDIEGHTEKSPVPRESPDDWDLTSQRANIARRLMLDHGIETAQVNRVAGYADTVPLPNVDPKDESNRRVTVMLKVNSSKFF